jgi:HSP20 family protein
MNANSMFDDVLTLRDLVNSFFDETSPRWRSREFPDIEFFGGKDDIEIRAMVPGLKADDINIHLVSESLVIEGEKKNDYADKPYLRRERKFGQFSKSVKLPYKVDANNISAEMHDGILVIKLHKSEDAKPKRIEIQ